MNKPYLSIIVISHNQRVELQRCIESILAMNLSFLYEIIISDDHSNDGTYELAQDYATKYSFIIASQCNSDDCSPANNSQRSGWNRCNGYKLAQGKYIAHVDADDYFRPNAHVYEKQVRALERHPECALAMSTCLYLKEGELIDNARTWNLHRSMQEDEVIDKQEFVRGDWFRINQCFMQRCNPDVDPVKLYGKRYVDSVITYHHLQFGKVVYVNACDYIYVGHPHSVVSELVKSDRDRDILWNLGLYIPQLIPIWKCDFYMGTYYRMIRDNIQMALDGYKLQPENYASLQDLHVWLYDCFARKLSMWDKARLHTIEYWMRFIKKTGCEYSLFISVLHVLLTKEL